MRFFGGFTDRHDLSYQKLETALLWHEKSLKKYCKTY